MVIEDNIPANTQIEKSSLEELRERGVIADYRIAENTVFLYLEEIDKKLELTYKLTAVMKGEGNHAGIKVVSMYNPEIVASYISPTLQVT